MPVPPWPKLDSLYPLPLPDSREAKESLHTNKKSRLTDKQLALQLFWRFIKSQLSKLLGHAFQV
jgi:hypothetical protein